MLSETRGRKQAGPGSLVSAELGEQDTILNTAAGRGPPAALLWEQEGKLHTAPSSRHLSRTFQGSETAGRFNRGKAARPCQEQMLRSARKPSPKAARDRKAIRLPESWPARWRNSHERAAGPRPVQESRALGNTQRPS